MKRLPLLLLLCLGVVGCDRGNDHQDHRYVTEMTNGGDPKKGKHAIEAYGCTACHTIPGIRGDDAVIGPPLNHMASRRYVAGVIKNNPDNMIRFIKDPPSIDNKTAMPNLHLRDSEARDIASYLYTLR